MVNKNPKLFLLTILLLLSLACGVSLSGNSRDDEMASLKLQLTRQALEKAQTAMAADGNQNSQPENPNSGGQSNNDQSQNEPEVVEDEEDETPCNDSHIIGETISDGTVFNPGEHFEKSWTLRNEGDCDWTTGYTLKFVEGNRMNGASSISVPSVIEPWEDITFKVNLTAPDKEGNYVGVWQLFAEDGEEMGRYWVDIIVDEPTPDFAVTSVSTNITNSNFSGPCPHVIDVEIYLTVNTAGEVTYQPETSDLGMGPVDTIQFDSAGTDTEFYTWTIHNAGNYWLKVHIANPNNQTFGPFNLTVTCQ